MEKINDHSLDLNEIMLRKSQAHYEDEHLDSRAKAKLIFKINNINKRIKKEVIKDGK